MSAIIIMNSNQKRPITPNQLFRQLMAADFKELVCQDETTRLRQQKEVLLQLICEYQYQISRVQAITLEEEKLHRLREKLLGELEILRNQRSVIDSKIGQEIKMLRVSSVEDKAQQSWQIQISEATSRNHKLRIRIKDLLTYIQKLQLQNRRLQQERRVIQVSQMQRRSMGEDWRGKIGTLQKEQFSYEMQMKERLRARQERSLREVQAQELEIRHRNQRRRAETLGGNRVVGHRFGEIHSRYVRQS